MDQLKIDQRNGSYREPPERCGNCKHCRLHNLIGLHFCYVGGESEINMDSEPDDQGPMLVDRLCRCQLWESKYSPDETPPNN